MSYKIPADYRHQLQILADRYLWTFGIFLQGNNAYLETITEPQKKHVIIVKPRVGAQPPQDCLCGASVKHRTRNTPCGLPADFQVGKEWRCILHQAALSVVSKA